MKSIPFLLIWLLFGSAAIAEENPTISAADARRLALRTVEWLVNDEWGQPDKQYKSSRVPEDLERWRASFSSRKPAVIAVTVRVDDKPADRLLFNSTSREISEPSPERGGYFIGINIAPHKEGGWRVRVCAGWWSFIHVVKQDASIVRRHESTWIID